MFPSFIDKQPLVFKLMVVLVLCVLLAPLGHAFEQQHFDSVDFTEPCEVCNWLLTAVFIAASVFPFCALCPRQRFTFVFAFVSSVSSCLRPSGRSPPCC